MGKKRTMMQQFRGAALGLMATMTALTGGVQVAQASQESVAQMVELNTALQNGPVADSVRRNIQNVDHLYDYLHDHVLNYQLKSTQGGTLDIHGQAAFLAQQYGLFNSPEHRKLNTMIQTHSDTAQAYSFGMGGQDNLDGSDTGTFVQLKAQANVGIVSALAEFTGALATQIEQDGIKQGTERSFAILCSFGQETGNFLQNMQIPYNPQVPLLPTHQSGAKKGQTVSCPPAR